MKKIFAILMVVTVLGAFLGGCGAKEEGGTTTPPAADGGTPKAGEEGK